MLQITISGDEKWNEREEKFVYGKSQTIMLEHSLVSLSKWESKWCKPFLSNEVKTTEETIDYIKCMTTTMNVAPDIYEKLSDKNIQEINEYIDSPMTATWFSKEKQKASALNREQITAELIYYWMITLNIPFECQKWHLNRLLTLIRVCNVKNRPPKKMSRRQLLSRNAALNAARRKQFNSRG